MPQVQFYAQMRAITGCSHLDIDPASASTLRELLYRLTKLFPGIQQNLLDARDNMYPDVPIFVNGRNPRLSSAGIDMSLEPEDVVTIFSPIASGRMNVEGMRRSATNLQE